jgi:hypothetical protein
VERFHGAHHGAISVTTLDAWLYDYIGHSTYLLRGLTFSIAATRAVIKASMMKLHNEIYIAKLY